MQKKQVKKQITTKQAEQLSTLIDAVKEKYSISDIAFYFFDGLDWGQRRELIAAIMSDADIKDRVKDGILSEERAEGAIILKVDSMDKKSQLEDFICTKLFPYHNEQATYLFS